MSPLRGARLELQDRVRRAKNEHIQFNRRMSAFLDYDASASFSDCRNCQALLRLVP